MGKCLVDFWRRVDAFGLLSETYSFWQQMDDDGCRTDILWFLVGSWLAVPFRVL